ncbi:hypothetical protein OAD62_06655 [Oceanihabitans sp.]|nr:hypothetical protein [Oceanihabitans sp.]
MKNQNTSTNGFIAVAASYEAISTLSPLDIAEKKPTFNIIKTVN